GIAVKEGARAERNFRAAKGTIDDVVFDLAQGLREVEGVPATTVTRILKAAETAVSDLASKTENEVGVRRSQAVMFALFSETYLKVGHTDLAVEHARKGVELSRSLLGSDDEMRKLRADLAPEVTRRAQ